MRCSTTEFENGLLLTDQANPKATKLFKQGPPIFLRPSHREVAAEIVNRPLEAKSEI
jgi:hypothetical protein